MTSLVSCEIFNAMNTLYSLEMWIFFMMIYFASIQSPGHFARQNSAYENPALTDNWDDAEGYYREY